MPEYLAPGVFVEEVSFRAPYIEPVATSTTGMAGAARYGPVAYDGGPADYAPRLVTSYAEYERIYGGIEPMGWGNPCYLGHAVRAFFLNGGSRVYVSRVVAGAPAAASVAVPDTTANWRARWPGAFGEVLVEVGVRRSTNMAVMVDGHPQASRAKAGSVVEIVSPAPATPRSNTAAVHASDLALVRIAADGHQEFLRDGNPVAVAAGDSIALVELTVTVHVSPDRTDVYEHLSTGPAHRRFVGTILGKDRPEDEDAVVWLDWAPTGDLDSNDYTDSVLGLVEKLAATKTFRLDGGADGTQPGADALKGREADPDHPAVAATGLEALGEIEDIAIVALPDAAALADDGPNVAAQYLLAHCEHLKYRIGVVDPPPDLSINGIRKFRGQFDSKYGALYHPWIEILDPTQSPNQGAPQERISLPPSGFVAGIYARTDNLRGVFKAPANEVVWGLTKFEANINTPRQQVLNPEGINALRFFPGRGNRVWGARTMSSDPEWKYVPVRRYFIYLEHSLDRSTQWAVFEPNNERLWRNVRHAIEDFLVVEWRNGALMGTKPEQAFFVACDRSTMTQADLDNGRLICLVGVAPVRPAEFVIFRVGQWTADAKTT